MGSGCRQERRLVKQRDDNEKEGRGESKYNTPTGAGQRQTDDGEDPLASGSPRNLVPIAMTVLLLSFAGVVFYVTASLLDSRSTRDNWDIAGAVLSSVGNAVFYSGLLVGLGTFATAQSKDVSSAASVARLLSYTGAVVVALGVAESVCIVGINEWSGWHNEASQIAFRLADRVFEGGMLAGMALLCLRRVKRSQS